MTLNIETERFKTAIISAFASAERGAPTRATLEAMLSNMGATSIRDDGPFDCAIHHDGVGGLMDGDPCVIERSGFILQGTVVVKAIVTPKQPTP